MVASSSEAAMAGQAKETFLGLDIGTSSVKALLVDFDQRVLAEASIPLTVSRPAAGVAANPSPGSRASRPQPP
jgi:ribulose kinase